MYGRIKAEWNPLKQLVVHKPGFEMFLGLLEPYGSLYERAFSRDGARREHTMLQYILEKEFGVEVFLLKDTILRAAKERPLIKERLVEIARQSLEYGGDEARIERAKREFDQNVKYMDEQHFFYIAIMSPLISFREAVGTRNIELNITCRQPVSNLYFMRDQQFMTDRGVVVCRMAKPSRRKECKITKFLLEEVLEIPVVHEMQAPATIEGGEFIPMGNFALVGIGDRTNRAAIDQLLTIDFDFQELGVVHQPLHPLISSTVPDPMINMHLDTYFNVASNEVVVGSELLLKNAQVEIYHNEGEGKWGRELTEKNLYDYIKSKGFYIINITTLEQMAYAANFLCVDNKQILAVEVERIIPDVLKMLKIRVKRSPKRLEKLYEQALQDYEFLKNEGQFFPHKKEIYQHGIDAYPVVLKNLTGGYGAAHCMTCALSRG